MKVTCSTARIELTVILSLLLAAPIASQSVPSNQTPVLLEIAYVHTHPSIPFSATYRVYADGRYVRESVITEKAKSGRDRREFLKGEKQLEPEEVTELVSWAEQPDFLNAQSAYPVTVVLEYPDWFLITYRNKDKVKSVKVINFSRGSEAGRAKVPQSVLKLLKWADSYYFELAEQKKK